MSENCFPTDIRLASLKIYAESGVSISFPLLLILARYVPIIKMAAASDNGDYCPKTDFLPKCPFTG